MLNLGLIGDIKLLEPFAKKIHEYPDIHIAGKSSVGTNTNPASFRFTIPEFNRVELIERSDALLINHFSLLPFKMLCDIVKKSKHIFATEYPDISIQECHELTKLANEAQTVFQVINPFYYQPAIKWLNENLKKPAYLDISFFRKTTDENGWLTPLLLMLKDTTGTIPKKISAVAFQPSQTGPEFNNLRLEFGNASSVNINFGKKSNKEQFKIKAWATGQEFFLDLISGAYFINNSKIKLKPEKTGDDLDVFVKSSLKKTSNYTGIDNYLTVLESIQKINAKLAQFSIL